MKKLVALALAASFSTAALAAPETFNIDPAHTLPRFEYNHMGFSQQLSRFDKLTGTITLDRVAKTGSIDVTIDAKSVNTGSSQFNEHIQGKDFLDTADFPTISYKSTAVKFNGDAVASVEGNLTIKGVTKPVVLDVSGPTGPVQGMDKKQHEGFNATTTIHRSDFGIGAGLPTAVLSEDVKLTIELDVAKQ
jgi:polyisoprenoid-binding protein YceI